MKRSFQPTRFYAPDSAPGAPSLQAKSLPPRPHTEDPAGTEPASHSDLV